MTQAYLANPHTRLLHLNDRQTRVYQIMALQPTTLQLVQLKRTLRSRRSMSASQSASFGELLKEFYGRPESKNFYSHSDQKITFLCRDKMSFHLRKNL